MCPHSPPCPAPSAPDREAAHTVVSHPEQGWSLLCNGVVIFEDTGELLPDGASIEPHRPTDLAAFDRPVGVAHERRAGPSGLIRPGISRDPDAQSDDSFNPFLTPRRPATGRRRRPPVTAQWAATR